MGFSLARWPSAVNTISLPSIAKRPCGASAASASRLTVPSFCLAIFIMFTVTTDCTAGSITTGDGSAELITR